MKHIRHKTLLLIFCLVFFQAAIFPQQKADAASVFYPEITELSSKNALFKQYMQDVEDFYMQAARRNGNIFLPTIYRYKCKPDDTLLAVAARCNIPIETIATLNALPSSGFILNGMELLLPAGAGLFIPEKPQILIDYLVSARFPFDETLPCMNNNGRNFSFYISERFSPTERAFFLNSAIRMPLAESVMTSGYGNRISPISGKKKFHAGVDLAAPEGTNVFACLPGKVICSSYNAVFGNFIILQHDNNMQSIYAHLSKRLVAEKNDDGKNTIVSAGQTIGLVGTTGASTGPHLHFEIKKNGENVNPENFFMKGF